MSNEPLLETTRENSRDYKSDFSIVPAKPVVPNSIPSFSGVHLGNSYTGKMDIVNVQAKTDPTRRPFALNVFPLMVRE